MADVDRFDVVFSDVVMPGMTGLDLAHAIRDRGIDVPIVLTSGYSDVLAQDGSFGFELLQKPYSIEALSRMLYKAARLRRCGMAPPNSSIRATCLPEIGVARKTGYACAACNEDFCLTPDTDPRPRHSAHSRRMRRRLRSFRSRTAPG